MKKAAIFVLISIFFLGCSHISTTDTVYQTSTIDALLAGVYDGELSLDELLKYGDFGIGTFDHLDGEMVILDRNVYQVKADGRVYRPDLLTKTPFATVCEFKPEQNLSLQPGMKLEQLKDLIDTVAPNQNLFYAFGIEGKFSHIKTRSVPEQTKPYPPLKEVTKNQPEFDMKNISGTIVGFRCPPFVKGINVPGYHLHFLSNDKSKGGHVLEFELSDGELELDVLNRYILQLPKETEDFAHTDLSKDRGRELEDVEHSNRVNSEQ